MHCIFCPNEFVLRENGGDHIVPQGLGRFDPDTTIDCVCEECDNTHGRTFELAAMRSGMISLFRIMHGVQSKYRKGKQKHNPSLDKFNAPESKQFQISLADGDEELHVNDDGEIRPPDSIVAYFQDEIIDEVKIPITRDTAAKVSFVQRILRENDANGRKSELKISEGQNLDLITQLEAKKIINPDQKRVVDETSEGLISIKGLLTINHFRFAASIIAKAMIFSGYSKDLLDGVLKFVHTGNDSSVIRLGLANPHASFDRLEKGNLHNFRHDFFWLINGDSLLYTAQFMKTDQTSGLALVLEFKLQQSKSPIGKYGHISARYSREKPPGQLIIFNEENQLIPAPNG